jgi:hypothetical protein
MKLKALLLGVLMAILVVPVPVLAEGSTDGEIEGQVFNKTQNNYVSEQEVILTTYLNDAEIGTRTVRTDAGGKFVFQELSTQPDYAYEAKVNFQDADYTSEKVDFKDGSTSKSVTITVYDSTTSTEAIRIETAHTIVYSGKDGLDIKTYAQVINDSNLTYIGAKQIAPDKRETLVFPVPEGVKDLQYGLSFMECCVVPGEGIVSDTMPVLPGSKELVYAYTIPYKGDTYTLTQSFDYPTGEFDLLVRDANIKVASDKLAQVEPMTIEGQQFNRFYALSLVAGDALKIELSGLPKSSRQQTLKWVGLGFVTLAFATGFVFLAKRRKSHAVPVRVATTLESDDKLVLKKQALLLELARLDDRFEAGLITEEAYHTQRANKKGQLIALLQLLAREGK